MGWARFFGEWAYRLGSAYTPLLSKKRERMDMSFLFLSFLFLFPE